jgi:hypothetical protein
VRGTGELTLVLAIVRDLIRQQRVVALESASYRAIVPFVRLRVVAVSIA